MTMMLIKIINSNNDSRNNDSNNDNSNNNDINDTKNTDSNDMIMMVMIPKNPDTNKHINDLAGDEQPAMAPQQQKIPYGIVNKQ